MVGEPRVFGDSELFQPKLYAAGGDYIEEVYNGGTGDQRREVPTTDVVR